VARVDRGGDRRAKVNIAEAEDEVVSFEDQVFDRRCIGKAIDAADKFDVVRAPWRIIAHRAHVLFNGFDGGGIAPAERQVDDARGDGEILKIAKPFFCCGQSGQCRALRHCDAIEVELQRADAGDDIDHAGQCEAFEFGHQGLDANAQFDVEHDRAVFDENVAIPLLAIDGARTLRAFGNFAKDRGERFDRTRRAGAVAFAAFQQAALKGIGHGGIDRIDGHEAQLVAGGQLPDFPVVCRDDHERANETAERRAIGAEDDRHVAGEIYRADRVRIIVDVRGVQPRLSAILARPLRLGTDQADAGAVAVVMDLPFCGDESSDIFIGEEIRCSVWSVKNTQGPFV
jgi:hypothetical protein